MKKGLKRRIISYSLTFVLISAFMAEGIREAVTFNHTEHIENVSESYLFPKEDTISLEPSLSFDETKENWEVAIDDGLGHGLTDDDKNYRSIFLNLDVKNNTNEAVNGYRIKIGVQKECYFLTGWCGTYEFHQFRDGNEIVETIDYDTNGNVKSKDGHTLDMVTSYNGEDYCVRLLPVTEDKKSDYVVYIPSASKGFATVSGNATVSGSGMILYESNSITEGTGASNFTSEQEIESSDSKDEDTDYLCDVKVEARNDSWNKIIDPENEGIDEPDYYGETFNIIYTNKDKYSLKTYSMTYTATKDMYLSSMWNGSVEIHQGDRTAYIKDLRNYDPESTGLIIIESGSDKLIQLSEGDYFVYTPSSEECPLNGYQSATTGFIVYQKIGESLGGTMKISYYQYRSLLTTPMLLVSVIFIGLWLLVLVFDALLYLRLKSFMKQKEHDEKMVTESIETFTGFIDAKDPYTNGHSHRVAYYSKLLAEEMGYSEEEQKRLYYIALLHDCGKIGIPDSILCKPSKLTDEEFDVIKSHPVRGAQVLKNFTSLEHVRDGVLYHHERYDGKGYPEGLKGEEIPLDARIICVADSFDAMNSNRCYRHKLTKQDIIDEFERCKGSQFDPQIAEIMMVLISSGKINMDE